MKAAYKELDKIAEGIEAHLKRFESDPAINKVAEGCTLHPYYHVCATRTYGHTVSVRYILFKGMAKLSESQAKKYLEWLNAGNIGTHFKMGIRGNNGI
jgi:hypothetical protein